MGTTMQPTDTLHRWETIDGRLVLGADHAGQLYFGDANEAILTTEGGLAIWLKNQTGGASVKGTLVALDTTHDDSVAKVAAGVPKAIGVIFESNIAVGEWVLVVVSGRAQVLFSDGQAATAAGWWAGVSATVDGQADVRETLPTNPATESTIHAGEIGHVAKSFAATPGSPVLAPVILHFN